MKSIRNTCSDRLSVNKREKEHYLYLQKSFENFNEAALRMQKAFSNLEKKFAQINRELEEKNVELKRTIAEKEEVKNYLENILGSLTTGVIVTDLQGRITILNRCAEQFCGISRECAIDKPVRDIFDAALSHDRKKNPDLLTHSDMQGRKVRMNGRVVEFFSSHVKTARGRVVGNVFVLRDITRIEKLEEMAKRTEKFAAMGEMAANIAHEIRNPLGSIELFASLLRKEVRDRKNRQRLLQIIASVKNMDNKITNLLLFARKPNPLMKRISLQGVLKEVLLFSKQLVEKEGISLSGKFSGVEPFVRGDSEMLKQVFLNIILNALQSMPEGGRLHIECSSSNASVEIRFADTGTGIPEEHLKKIFDPFFSTRERGSGLGLAIVHNIIDIHGGSIDVESSNRGTVFSITLPLLGRKSYSENPRAGSETLRVGG
ncbi:MAG: PAS domain-containing sensor histidine kinase [Syntrophales bacterium]